MNTPVKHIFYALSLLLTIACLVIACTPKNISPNTAVGTSIAKTDSIAKADTFPSFDNPTGIAVDAGGNIYVADYGNNLIRMITPNGFVSTLAGTGMQGSINAAGTLASFNGPAGIALDAQGNLYIADAGNNLIRKMTTTGVVSTLAGGDTTGAVNGTGVNASFFDPLGVTLDGTGNVYVADAGNNLIRVISPAGVVTTLAGNGVNATTSNGTLSASSFNNPTGVAIDKAGNIYVANYLNDNILEVNAAGVVSTFAGSGQQGAANGPATSATFYFPNSVALDGAGNVYVADGVNNLIRVITPGGIASTLAGSGIAGSTDGTGTAASFNGPAGLAVDAAGNVYVADSGNNLIRKITTAGVVTTVAGTILPGSKNGKAFAHRNTVLSVNISKNKLYLLYGPKK